MTTAEIGSGRKARMRLIDADALPDHKFSENQCNKFGDGAHYRQGWNDAIDAIVDNEPTVDAVPVRRGKWERHYCEDDGIPDGWQCNQCNNWFYFDRRPKYCPDCGAQMGGEQA